MFDCDDKMFFLFVFSSVKMCVSSKLMFLCLNSVVVGSVKLSSMSDGSGCLMFWFLLVCFFVLFMKYSVLLVNILMLFSVFFSFCNEFFNDSDVCNKSFIALVMLFKRLFVNKFLVVEVLLFSVMFLFVNDMLFNYLVYCFLLLNVLLNLLFWGLLFNILFEMFE